QSNMILPANTAATVNLPLSLGGTTEKVQVTAAAVLLDPESANNTATLDPQLIQSLPNSYRNPLNFVFALAGTTEAHSGMTACSSCEPYQARRSEIRYRPTGGGKADYCHTRSGSGLAVGRTLIAVLENYQNADGTVTTPAALRSYMDGLERLTPLK